MLLSLSAGTVVISVSFAQTNMQKKLLTGQNIDSQVIALDLGVVQKGHETGTLGTSTIAAAVNFLVNFAGVFGDSDGIVRAFFASEGGRSSSGGEEENSKRLDGDHFD